MKEKGFTLIELMIVIAIIGVLASVAIPMYQDYLVRAKITEGLSMASSAQTTVAENAMMGNADLSTGWTKPTPTVLVQSVTIAANTGVVSIHYSDKVNQLILSMVPSANGESLTAGTPPTAPLIWTCQVNDAKNNRYVPANCRI